MRKEWKESQNGRIRWINAPPRQVGGPSYIHERVSSVGDLGGGYIKESLK